MARQKLTEAVSVAQTVGSIHNRSLPEQGGMRFSAPHALNCSIKCEVVLHQAVDTFYNLPFIQDLDADDGFGKSVSTSDSIALPASLQRRGS